ncbi:MAG: hypothetical protein AB1792_01955 [Candidatus Zixiibacteriota bacterium]
MSPRARRTAAARPSPVRRAPRRVVRRGRGTPGPKQPFSLILNPEELNILRKMARRENTSVASVIRHALHTVIFRSHPDLAKHAIEKEVESFLDTVGARLPKGLAKGVKRSRLRNQLVTGLLGKGR